MLQEIVWVAPFTWNEVFEAKHFHEISIYLKMDYLKRVILFFQFSAVELTRLYRNIISFSLKYENLINETIASKSPLLSQSKYQLKIDNNSNFSKIILPNGKAQIGIFLHREQFFKRMWNISFARKRIGKE